MPKINGTFEIQTPQTLSGHPLKAVKERTGNTPSSEANKNIAKNTVYPCLPVRLNPRTVLPCLVYNIPGYKKVFTQLSYAHSGSWVIPCQFNKWSPPDHLIKLWNLEELLPQHIWWRIQNISLISQVVSEILILEWTLEGPVFVISRQSNGVINIIIVLHWKLT